MKESLETKIASLIARCWTDEEFKKRFMAEPKSVIAEVLLGLAPGAELVVLQDTREKHHLILPEAPREGFAMADLDEAARRVLHPASALYCFEEHTVAPAPLYCRRPPGETRYGAPHSAEASVSPMEAPYCHAEPKLERIEPYCFEDTMDAAAPYCREAPHEAPYCRKSE